MKLKDELSNGHSINWWNIWGWPFPFQNGKYCSKPHPRFPHWTLHHLRCNFAFFNLEMCLYFILFLKIKIVQWKCKAKLNLPALHKKNSPPNSTKVLPARTDINNNTDCKLFNVNFLVFFSLCSLWWCTCTFGYTVMYVCKVWCSCVCILREMVPTSEISLAEPVCRVWHFLTRSPSVPREISFVIYCLIWIIA